MLPIIRRGKSFHSPSHQASKSTSCSNYLRRYIPSGQPSLLYPAWGQGFNTILELEVLPAPLFTRDPTPLPAKDGHSFRRTEQPVCKADEARPSTTPLPETSSTPPTQLLDPLPALFLEGGSISVQAIACSPSPPTAAGTHQSGMSPGRPATQIALHAPAGSKALCTSLHRRHSVKSQSCLALPKTESQGSASSNPVAV